MKWNKLLYYLHYNYQRTLEETGKRGQETYYLKSCLQLSCCLAFHRLLECTGIKVCLITSILVKPSSSRTLLVQTPQLTFVSQNRIPDISLQCDKQITWGFGYRPQYQPSTIISPRAKALRLIMGSQVDTLGGNQNTMR